MRRYATLIILMCAFAVVLVTRILFEQHGQAARDFRLYNEPPTVEVLRPRGAIYDRNGDALAISTPTKSVVAFTQFVDQSGDRVYQLARRLKRELVFVEERLNLPASVDPIYIARFISSDEAAKVAELNIPGIYLKSDYIRYYPTGETIGSLIGYTDINGEGIEGLERTFDATLSDSPGIARLIIDFSGHILGVAENVRDPRRGNPVTISLDSAIQSAAYRELKASIRDNHARSGSVAIADVSSGEILASVSLPSLNPNDREQHSSKFRGRFATDIFEPGSAIDPFFYATALLSGSFASTSIVDTSPGTLRIGETTFRDAMSATLSLEEALDRSSNVAMAKVAADLPPKKFLLGLKSFGLGDGTHSQFPGEAIVPIDQQLVSTKEGRASIACGYDIVLTEYQLLRAYVVLGSLGMDRKLTFSPVSSPPVADRAFSEAVAIEVIKGGIRQKTIDEIEARSDLPHYQVSGFNGISRIRGTTRCMATFGAVFPASRPRIATVAVVELDANESGDCVRGSVAPRLVSSIAPTVLRQLAVPPDKDF